MTSGLVASSAAIAVGNTLEGLIGAHLVRRFAGGTHAFNRARDVFIFTGDRHVPRARGVPAKGCSTLRMGLSMRQSIKAVIALLSPRSTQPANGRPLMFVVVNAHIGGILRSMGFEVQRINVVLLLTIVIFLRDPPRDD